MLRRLGLVTGWAAATAAVVALGWAAVSAVAGTVAEPPPLAQPPVAAAEPVEPVTQPPADTAAPDPGASPEPAATPEPAVQTFELVGGTVAVSAGPATAELVFATPRSGFVVDVRSRGPSRVDVRFSSPEHETRFRYDPADGEQVEERPE